MKQRLASLAVGLALTAGCAKNDASVQIQQLCSMPDDCTFSSTCETQPIGNLELDVGLTDQMFLALEVKNQLADNSDSGSGHTNTHNAHVESVAVSYDTPTGVSLPDFTQSVQQLVPTAGSAVVGVLAVPPSAGVLLQGAVTASTPTAPIYVPLTAKVTLKGRYDDGQAFETGHFDIPILVCMGCFAVPTCTDATQVPVACPSVGQHPRGAVSCVTP